MCYILHFQNFCYIIREYYFKYFDLFWVAFFVTHPVYIEISSMSSFSVFGYTHCSEKKWKHFVRRDRGDGGAWGTLPPRPNFLLSKSFLLLRKIKKNESDIFSRSHNKRKLPALQTPRSLFNQTRLQYVSKY